MATATHRSSRDRLRLPAGAVPALVEGFRRNDLLLFASAISFQVLTAVVPLALFGLGLVAFLDLTELYTTDLRPEIARQVSIPMFVVIDSTVERVLGEKQLFWITLGAALATWQLSGAVRAAMEALNRVNGHEETRGWKDRYLRSFLLAIAGGALLFAAAAVVRLGPAVVGDRGPVVGVLVFALRWALAAAPLFLAVALLIRHGADRPEQDLGWVSLGAGIVCVAWLGMSVLFGIYLTQLASYGSVFGALATVVVLMGYLYASAVTFVAGIQVDALLRERA